MAFTVMIGRVHWNGTPEPAGIRDVKSFLCTGNARCHGISSFFGFAEHLNGLFAG